MSKVENKPLTQVKALLGGINSILDSSVNKTEALQWQGREPKAQVDRKLSQFIVDGLRDTGISILSEEGDQNSDWLAGAPTWIIDPLDGTLNFVRNCGPSSISISLWEGAAPIFGAILDVGSREFVWGGKQMGSWLGSKRLDVSVIDGLQVAVLCTGIPASFDFSEASDVANWVKTMSLFGKVRMIGSAASSLVLVAKGAADCYFERSVKIWDVAAGLAILEGAGGQYHMVPAGGGPVVNVLASNTALSDAFPKNHISAD